MKKLLLLTIIISGIMIACEEVGPFIDFSPEEVDTSLMDTTYIATQDETPQQKNVLIEDFTGVNCPNCPKAAEKIDELQTKYPGRIVAVSIHPDGSPFTEPFPGRVDFRTHDGTLIYTMLGKSTGLPKGAVDRYFYDQEERILTSYSNWSGYVDDRIKMSSPVNIDIHTSYKSDSSENAIVKVKIHYTEAVSDTHFVSVMLTEGGIVDWQILPFSVIDSSYTHNHVFREILTDYNGDELMLNPEKNRVFVREYKVRIADAWVDENCEVIAFVHKRTDNGVFDVVHAVHADLVE